MLLSRRSENIYTINPQRIPDQKEKKNTTMQLATSAKPFDQAQVTCNFLDRSTWSLNFDKFERKLDGHHSYEFMDIELLKRYHANGLCKSKEELVASGSDAAKKFETEEKAIKELFKHDLGGGILNTKSSPGRNLSRNVGRIYPENNTSIRSLRGSLRNLMTYKNMVEIDIVNCHATILFQVALVMNLKAPTLQEYVQCRVTIRKETEVAYKVTPSHAKGLFLRIMYGGTFHNWYIETFGLVEDGKEAHKTKLPDGVKPTQFIRKFEKEMDRVASAIRQKNHALANAVQIDGIKPKKSRVVSYFCQEVEYRILTVAHKMLDQHGLIQHVWFTLHDGIFVPQYLFNLSNQKLVDGIKATLRNAVHEELGIFVHWDVKGVELDEKSRAILKEMNPNEDYWEQYFDDRSNRLAEIFHQLDNGATISRDKKKRPPVSLDELGGQLTKHVDSNLKDKVLEDFGGGATIEKTTMKQATVTVQSKTCLFGICSNQHQVGTYELVNDSKDQRLWVLKEYECNSCRHKMKDDHDICIAKTLTKTEQVEDEIHKSLKMLPLWIEVAGKRPSIVTTEILSNMVKRYRIQVDQGRTFLTCDVPIKTNKRTCFTIQHRGLLLLQQSFLEGPQKVDLQYNKDNLFDLTKKVFGKEQDIKMAEDTPEIYHSKDDDGVRFQEQFLSMWNRVDSTTKLTYFMKGSTGAGKTNAVTSDILPLMERETTMLQPCPRVSLGQNTQKRYNDALKAKLGTIKPEKKRRKTSNGPLDSYVNGDWKVGFYNDDNKFESNKLIIQVDSMHKIDPQKDYEVVIIDELGSVLKQFLSSQITIQNAIKGLGILVRLIKRCHKLILMDADLDEFEVGLILGWRGPQSVEHLVYGTHAVATFAAKGYRFVKRKMLVQEYLRDIFLRGKRVILPSSSKNELEVLEGIVLDFARGNRTITGEEVEDPPPSWEERFEQFAQYWDCGVDHARERIDAILNGIVTLDGDSSAPMKKHFIVEGKFEEWTPEKRYQFIKDPSNNRWTLGDQKVEKGEKKSFKVENSEKKSFKVVSFNYSPTLMAGVSIETDNFDSQFGIFSSLSVPATGANQMNNRARKVPKCTLAIIGASVAETQLIEDIKDARNKFVEEMKIHGQFGFRSCPNHDLDMLRGHYNSVKRDSESNLKEELCAAFNENNFGTVIYDNPDEPHTNSPIARVYNEIRLRKARELLEVKQPYNEHRSDDELNQMDEVSRDKYFLQKQFGEMNDINQIRMILYLKKELDNFAASIDEANSEYGMNDVSVVSEKHRFELRKTRLRKLLYQCGFVESENNGKEKNELFIGLVKYVEFCRSNFPADKESKAQFKEQLNPKKLTGKVQAYNCIAQTMRLQMEKSDPTIVMWYKLLKKFVLHEFSFLFAQNDQDDNRAVKTKNLLGVNKKVVIVQMDRLRNPERFNWLIQLTKKRLKCWDEEDENQPFDEMRRAVDAWELADIEKDQTRKKSIIQQQIQREHKRQGKDPEKIIENYVKEQQWYFDETFH